MVDGVGIVLSFQAETDWATRVELHGGPIRSHLHDAPTADLANTGHENDIFVITADPFVTAVEHEVVIVEAHYGLVNLIEPCADEFWAGEIQRRVRYRQDVAGRNQLAIG